MSEKPASFDQTFPEFASSDRTFLKFASFDQTFPKFARLIIPEPYRIVLYSLPDTGMKVGLPKFKKIKVQHQ
jgi:hypothetical protein